MGLSNFPSPAEGMLPVLVMNTVMYVAVLKNLVRSVLQLVGAAAWVTSNLEENDTAISFLPANEMCPPSNSNRRRSVRGISITKFKSLCERRQEEDDKCTTITTNCGAAKTDECCVCLCKFREEEDVSELSCKHFFHRKCLDKWFFDNHHSTCPLCRSIH